MKKVVVSVTNDLVTDQRVMRTIGVLQDLGFEPVFVGRQRKGSMPFQKGYGYKRFRLWFNSGFLFYANYNLRLFIYLLFHRFDLYLSNDLDTLLPNFLISKLRGKPLIYDSHEYFTGVPEIQHRPVVKAVWTRLERMIFPRLKQVVTVNESIADLYEQEYSRRPVVIRNISDSTLPESIRSRTELGLPGDGFILINQGAGINVDRGMEEAIEALKHLPPKVVLLIVGDGDAVPGLKQLTIDSELEDRVIFKPKQPYLEMLQYTLNADVGLSLDKPLSPNYRFSLPNKVFDYIKCGLPLLVSSVVEVEKVVNSYALGEVVDKHEPAIISQAVLKLMEKGKTPFQAGLTQASAENNWELEQEKWKLIFSSHL